MTGVIKTYLSEKQYGFIKGDNKKDYFFHISDILKAKVGNIVDGAFVEFEEKATPKGYSAIKIIVKQIENKDIKYIVPKEVYISEHDNINGWETISFSVNKAHSSSRNPREAKQQLIALAKNNSTNALLNLYRYTSTGSEMSNSFSIFGTHQYTIHHYSANIANIGKKHVNGTHTREELQSPNIAKASQIITPSMGVKSVVTYSFIILFLSMLVLKLS